MIKKLIICLSVLVLTACGDSNAVGNEEGSGLPGLASESGPPGDTESRQSLKEIHQQMDLPVLAPWYGDLDAMLKRRVIRVLTVYGLSTYFIENGQEGGIAYEMFKSFEADINKREGNKTVQVHVLFIPVARDELIPALLEGYGDIATGGLTITPEREELVDFSEPITRELSEVLVTGPSAPPVLSIADLSGHEVYVRASSSYRASLDALNRQFAEQGIEPVVIQNISEVLEDEDILEMVNSGALEWAIVDDYKAKIFADVFQNLVVRNDIVFRSDGRIGYAFRKDSPQLKSFLNQFLESHRQGTLMGNILINRYIRDIDWTKNVLNERDYEQFEKVVGIFEKYGEEYGIDYLMATAQGYQESRLRQNTRSKEGAIGIMQLLPSTASDPNVDIPDITIAPNNIHAGIKYMNFIRNRYFSDPGMDDFNKTLFALASYNAGPARVADLRLKAEQQGYDPDIWFDNVEIIAAREIGSETVQYVANIMKYYMVYRLSMIRTQQTQQALESRPVD